MFVNNVVDFCSTKVNEELTVHLPPNSKKFAVIAACGVSSKCMISFIKNTNGVVNQACSPEYDGTASQTVVNVYIQSEDGTKKSHTQLTVYRESKQAKNSFVSQHSAKEGSKHFDFFWILDLQRPLLLRCL
jgi:hypothetical protein